MQITDSQVCNLSERLMNGLPKINASMLAHAIRFMLEECEKDVQKEIGLFGMELLLELLDETPN